MFLLDQRQNFFRREYKILIVLETGVHKTKEYIWHAIYMECIIQYLRKKIMEKPNSTAKCESNVSLINQKQ